MAPIQRSFGRFALLTVRTCFRSASQLLLAVLLLMLEALVSPASAQAPFAPQLIPQVPVESQPFLLRLMRRNCDVFLSTGPTDRIAERHEVQISVTVEYIPPPPGGGGCDFGTTAIDWTIGPFPSGDYTLTVMGQNPFDEGTSELTSLQFTIQPMLDIGAQTIPTLGRSGLLGLMLIVVLAGFFGRRWSGKRR